MPFDGFSMKKLRVTIEAFYLSAQKFRKGKGCIGKILGLTSYRFQASLR